VVLNADDVLLPWSAEAIMGIWRTHREIRLLGGNAIVFRRPAALISAASYPKSFAQQPLPDIRRPEDIITYERGSDLNMTMSSMSFVRSAWQAVGGFRPKEKRVFWSDDRDFQLRVGCLFPVAIIDEPLVMYRMGTSTWNG
jgi:hypothetical protein